MSLCAVGEDEFMCGGGRMSSCAAGEDEFMCGGGG